MRVAVTGAGGFLGRRIVAELRAEGWRARAILRPGGRPCPDADETVEADLGDRAALERALEPRVECVVHAGARVTTLGSWEDFRRVNVEATEHLLRLAEEGRVGRIVHISSLSVYAVPHDGAVITEDCPYDEGGERGGYARSKREADRRVCAAIERGVAAVVLRPGLLYGPGRRPPLARRWVALGPLRLIFARPAYLLPLSFVDNVAFAARLAAGSQVRGPYNLVDEHVEQDRFLRLVREISGERWVPVHVPVSFLPLAAGVLERGFRILGRRPPVTRHQVERTVWAARFDTSRAERELGWSPRVSLDEALRRTLSPLPSDISAAKGINS